MRPDALGELAEMTQRLLDDPDLGAALQRVTDTALRIVEADHASVRLCAHDGKLEVGARSGVGTDRPPPVFRKGEGLLGWVAATGNIVRVDHSALDPRFQDRRERGFDVGSILSVPVGIGTEPRAVLSLSSARSAAFSESDEAVARLLASAAALALRTAELRELAVTDPHTGAYNRRCLLPRLREEMQRGLRTGEHVSVVLFDLDHFKRVNDRWGHAVGDAVLRAVADCVREQVRAMDVLVRRGGEEFVLLLPRTNGGEARDVAERVRSQLAYAPLAARPGVNVRQTISMGVATWDGTESAEALEERADLAMYEAKRMGRNRVVCAQPVPLIVLAKTIERVR
jgi:two-component system cell cycle response regulator